MEAAGPCTDMAMGMKVNALDAGSMAGTQTCFLSKCMKEYGDCAGDCSCNNNVYMADLCVAGGMAATTCFGSLVSGGDAQQTALLTCLVTNMASCGIAPPSDAGEGGTPPADGSASDAPVTSDAPAGG